MAKTRNNHVQNNCEYLSYAKNKRLQCCYKCCPKSCIKENGELKIEPLQVWLQLIAMFIMTALIAVPDSTFGLFYDPLVDRYNVSRASVGWAMSLLFTTMTFTGIFVTPFFEVYGYQSVSLLGAALTTIGMVLAAYPPTYVCFHLFYGVVSGIGLGILILGTFTVIQHNFTYNLGLALGIVNLGFTAGTTLSPIIISHCLEEYGLSGALLIHGGIMAHSLVTAWANKIRPSKSSHKTELPDELIMDCRDDGRLDGVEDGATYQTIRKIEDDSADKELVDNGQPKHNGHCNGKSVSDKSQNDLQDDRNNKNGFDPLMGSNNKLKNGEIHERISESFTEYTYSSGLNTDSKHNTIEIKQPKTNIRKTLLHNFMNFSVCKNNRYILFIVFSGSFMASRSVILAQFAGVVIHRGGTSQDAASHMAIMGVCNAIFRTFSVILMNFKWFDPVLYGGSGVLALLASCILTIYAKSTTELGMCMALLGACEGITNTVTGLILVRIVGVNNFARGMAVQNAVLLPFALLSAPVSGWLVDVTGDYAMTFMFAAILGIVAFIMISTISIMNCKSGAKGLTRTH